MKLQNKYTIALVGFRLSGGGAERVMANLSVYFDQIGIEVYIVTVIDELGYEFRGKVFSTSASNYGYGITGRYKRFLKLKQFFSTNKFDFIIDFRFRTKGIQEWVIAKYIYKAPTVFTIHSSKIHDYIPTQDIFSKWIYGKAYQMVAITEEINRMVTVNSQLSNVTTIYNPVDFESIDRLKVEAIDLQFDYIIGVGQYENGVKQFDHLIEAYSKSSLRHHQIHLVICGTGRLIGELKEQVISCKIVDFVHFIGFQDNPYKYIKNAKFLTLSSQFEGLPMVLIESLACETPVVSYDCLSGPKEIVIPYKNGLLVEDQNIDKLKEALDLFIDNVDLYNSCKAYAKESIGQFSLEIVGQKWVSLMKMS
ncbi:glycosyltransferase [Flavobacterium sp. NKUCC04_CG]|uniref:glycosyltransferase n=1 Tax=Flavobacterium sp. NKUCC04_CG TaxID=2842121 RepID=UPI001C5B0CF6|nr:glycosyltransferase [Flavobacterium sp. NKUCC04_CG]MBW3518024.1 glycosyltransferase [Flavobacterium sp. NKUCC04_CG]